jgi:Spy/CpxP family protein refolding chaperone
MVKKLLGIAAVIALFTSIAIAQEQTEEVVVQGPDTTAVQPGPQGGGMGPGPMRWHARPGSGFMGGPGSRTFDIRVRGPMGGGPMMWFHGRGMGQWWRNPDVAERVGLNDQQKQQLEKISQDSRLKMIDLRANLEKQQVILGPMLQTYHPEEAAVLAQVEKVSQARAAVEKQRVQTMLACRSVLTEEQWNKLKSSRMEVRRTFVRRGFRGPMRNQPPATPQSK